MVNFLKKIVRKAGKFGSSLLNISTRRRGPLSLSLLEKRPSGARLTKVGRVGAKPLIKSKPVVKPGPEPVKPLPSLQKPVAKRGRQPQKRTVATSVQRPTKPIQRRRSTQTLATLSRKIMR